LILEKRNKRSQYLSTSGEDSFITVYMDPQWAAKCEITLRQNIAICPEVYFLLGQWSLHFPEYRLMVVPGDVTHYYSTLTSWELPYQSIRNENSTVW